MYQYTSTVKMYADDTKLFRMVNNVSECLELSLNEVS